MTADETYRLLLFIVAKNKSQGYVSPTDFQTVFNQAQKGYVAYLVGSFQKYANGRPVAPVEFGQNSVERQRLTPSIYQYNLAIDGSGFSPYPGDYLQTDAMWSIYGLGGVSIYNAVSIYNYNQVRYVQQHRLYRHLKSSIDPVANNPIYLIEDRGFRFYPTYLSTAKLSYIKNPPDIVWGYTLDVNGRAVYSQVASVDPIFDDLAMMEIIARALQMVGVNLQFGAVLQYAQEIKQNGQ